MRMAPQMGLTAPVVGNAGVQLATLVLSASSVAESASVATVVGAVQNTTASSTLSLTDDASGKFDLNSGNVRVAAGLDYEMATSHGITVRETLAGAINTPRDTVLTITVTNVLEITLAALTLNNSTCAPTDVQGTAVGTITGASSGSTVSLLSQSTANAFQKNGTGIEVGSAAPLASGSYTITLRETHSDASNSPRDSVISITVAVVLTPGPDLVTNGGASSGADWTASHLGAAVDPTISGGLFRFTADTNSNTQIFTQTLSGGSSPAGTYKVTLTATGGIQVRLLGAGDELRATANSISGAGGTLDVVATGEVSKIRMQAAGNDDNGDDIKLQLYS